MKQLNHKTKKSIRIKSTAFYKSILSNFIHIRHIHMHLHTEISNTVLTIILQNPKKTKVKEMKNT